MKSILVFLLAVSPCAFAQDGIRTDAVYQSASPGVVAARAIDRGIGSTVQGAPYSATITNESIQTLADGTHITIPRYAFWFSEYGWGVENHGVDPDIEVLITPDDWSAARDPQLEVAVDRALDALAAQPPVPVPDLDSVPSKRRPPLPPRNGRPSRPAREESRAARSPRLRRRQPRRHGPRGRTSQP